MGLALESLKSRDCTHTHTHTLTHRDIFFFSKIRHQPQILSRWWPYFDIFEFFLLARRLIVVGPFEGVLGHTEAQRFQPMIQINIGRVLLSVRITFAQCVVSAAIHSGHGRRSSPLQAHSTGKRLDGLEKTGQNIRKSLLMASTRDQYLGRWIVHAGQA